MPRLCREHATPDEVRRGRARGGARAPPRKLLHLGSRGSCLLRRGNAVDPPTLLLGRGEGEPELLLQGSRKKRPRTVCCCQPIALATSSTVAPSDRCSIATTASCFDGGFVSDCWSGSGSASTADHS